MQPLLTIGRHDRMLPTTKAYSNMLWFLLSCTPPVIETGNTVVPTETGELETGVADTQHTTETGETGETGETVETGETGDTQETDDTQDSVPVVCDGDGDGVDGAQCGGSDCDDTSDRVYPGASETLDGVDNDCNGTVDRTDLDALVWMETASPQIDARISAIDNLSSGDLNGDGTQDLIIGAPIEGGFAGAVYLLDGSAVGSWTGDLSADHLFKATGESPGGAFGFVSQGMGDVNGDGISDLLVGARQSEDRGTASVWFGGALSGTSTASEADVFIENDSNPGRMGWAVDSNGDVDGDGIAEVILGDPTAEEVLIFRSPSGSLSSSDADAVLENDGSPRLGESVLTGDVNADGYADLLIGRPAVNSNDGEVVVVLGGSTLPAGTLGRVSWASLQGDSGGEVGSNSRGTMNPADLDGSGQVDLAIGDYKGAEAVYVFLDPVGGKLTPSDADLMFQESGSTAGSSVMAGDLDQDGLTDLVIGAYGDGSVYNQGGAVYLLFGADIAAGSSFSRSSTSGVIDANAVEELVGTAVHLPGDLSGDGFPDLVVGASWDNSLAERGGRVVVIAGVARP